MPQLAEQSVGLVDKITAHGATLTTLTQTVARGVPALRDASENVLELNPATSTPLLTSNANDVGMSYNAGTLAVVDKTGQLDRPLTADKVTVGQGATGINAGGVFGDAATLNQYANIGTQGTGNFFVQNGTATATGFVRGTGGTFGGVDIGNGGGINTYGRAVQTGGATMDSGGVFGNAVNGFAASFGGVDINNGGIATHGRSITAANFFADSQVTTGGARMDGGGIFGNAVNGFAGSFGGIDINNGGIATNGRTITCGSIFPARVGVGASVMDGNGVAGFSGTFGGVALGNNGISAPGTIVSGWYHSLGDINADRSVGAGENMVARGFVTVSDRKLKSNIRDLPHGLFDKLRPRTFTFRNDETDTPRMGFVAQELPDELQQTADGVARYDVSHVLAVAVAEVKRQAGVIADLTARLDALEAAA